MKTIRLTLAALGIAAMAYATAGAAGDRDITPGRHIGFLLTILAIHDSLLLPAFIGIGALVHRYTPPSAKAAIQAALLATAALTLIATPLILGYGRLADNPSALPRNYPAGLAIVLGAIWLTTGGFIHARRTRRRSLARRQVDARAPDPTAPTAGSRADAAKAEGGTDAQHH